MKTTTSVRINLAFSVFSFLVFSFLVSGLASAWDTGGVNVTVQPRLQVGAMYYAFEQDAVSLVKPVEFPDGTNGIGVVTQNKIKLEDTMPTLSLGLGFAVDKFTIDFYAQKAFNGSDTTSLVSTVSYLPPLPPKGFELNEQNIKADFDRNEYSLAVGYAITEQFFINIGYRWAETDFKNKGEGRYIFENPFSNTGGSIPYTSSFKFEFENNGPYMGLNYGLNFEDSEPFAKFFLLRS